MRACLGLCVCVCVCLCVVGACVGVRGQKGIPFSGDVLTPALLKECMGMLEFGKFNGKYDIKLSGLGLEYYVSEVQTTVLKGAKIGKNIPTVAEKTQGEVVAFASKAVQQMGADGFNVIMEGRAQTLNHVRSPYRVGEWVGV